jgi:N-acetylmuramoyl-L-alanine amidase
MPCKKVYLSPSNQEKNLFVVGNTNEKVQMEKIAARIKEILDSEYQCSTMIASSSLSINQRDNEAKANNFEVYLAIHSNAGGGGTASGAVAFYHPRFTDSRRLAANVVSELNRVCPIESNRTDPVVNGLEVLKGKGYAEIRLPGQLDLIPVLVETNFHDNPLTAQWMINNTNTIAQAYVNALVLTFDFPRTSQTRNLFKTSIITYKRK